MFRNFHHAILESNKLILILVFFVSFRVFPSSSIDDGDMIPSSPPMWEYFSIDGLDSDNDGVRDDVELWINKEFKDSNVRKALKGLAIVYKDLISNWNNETEYRKANELMNIRSLCLYFVKGTVSYAQAHQVWEMLEEKILNNLWRKIVFKMGAENISSGAYAVADLTYYQLILGCDFRVHEPEKIMKDFLKRRPKYRWTEKEQKKFKDMYENPNNYNALDILGPKRRDL